MPGHGCHFHSGFPLYTYCLTADPCGSSCATSGSEREMLAGSAPWQASPDRSFVSSPAPLRSPASCSSVPLVSALPCKGSDRFLFGASCAVPRPRSSGKGPPKKAGRSLVCRWRFLASAGGPGRPISIDRQGLGILWVMSQLLLRIAAIAQRSARDPARSPRLFKIGLEPATPNHPRDLWPIQTPCRSSAEHCAFFRFRVCRSSITDLWSIVSL